MKATINGTTHTDLEDNTHSWDGPARRVVIDGMEFLLFETRTEACAVTREYWEDMAHNDPQEFRCMVGDECLIHWCLGIADGPGSAKVTSLEEWLDVCADHPEEHLASYDGEEVEVALDTEAAADLFDLDGPATVYGYRVD